MGVFDVWVISAPALLVSEQVHSQRYWHVIRNMITPSPSWKAQLLVRHRTKTKKNWKHGCYQLKMKKGQRIVFTCANIQPCNIKIRHNWKLRNLSSSWRSHSRKNCHDMKALCALLLLALRDRKPPVTCGFSSQRVSIYIWSYNILFHWYRHAQTAVQIVKSHVIWDAMKLMWRHCWTVSSGQKKLTLCTDSIQLVALCRRINHNDMFIKREKYTKRIHQNDRNFYLMLKYVFTLHIEVEVN